MRSRSACFLSGLVLAVAASTAAGDEPELAQLLDRMAASAGVEARFLETKELSLLAVPLESRGVIYFAPPERFARFTTEPDQSALIVREGEIRLREGPDAPEVDLSGNRVARAFTDNIVVLWSGDRERLEALYRAEFRGGLDAWEIVLAPRDPRMAEVIAAIRLRGDGGGLTEMEINERDGDRTLTRFEHVDDDRVFTPAEIERVFGAGRPLDPAGEAH